ncbi:UTP--glucose-1-phosphate uridylyltransferase [Candidatus Dojkabacteria bacterium]|nr:UTP--glucose-1-phosphate uridylyltransferase [Candidatus Dojkabacteria bacterium]
MSNIKTAVIPTGGYGTRFLPASKSIPKEMFPLWNKPIVYHVVEEAVKSGIENIVFIVSPMKHSVEDFFSPNQLEEDYLLKKGKIDQVGELRGIQQLANYSFVYTKSPYGNGGALLSAKHLIKNEPFVVVWGDEMIISKTKPRIQQCIETYEKYGKPVISAIEIKDPLRRQKYGIAELKDIEGDSEVKEIVRIVEKPQPGTEPSSIATHGTYVLPPEIFEYFDETFIGKDGELWLTDLINNLNKKTGLLAKIIPDGIYLDCGNPIDYMLSQLEFVLESDESKAIINDYLNSKGYKKDIA